MVFELDGEIEELGHKVTRLGHVIESVKEEALVKGLDARERGKACLSG